MDGVQADTGSKEFFVRKGPLSALLYEKQEGDGMTVAEMRVILLCILYRYLLPI